MRQIAALDEGRSETTPPAAASVFPTDDTMALPEEELENAFRHMWGDNGDMVSMMYAGTRYVICLIMDH